MPTDVGASLSVGRAVLKTPTRLFTFLLIAKNVILSCCDVLHVQFVRVWIHCPKIQTDSDIMNLESFDQGPAVLLSRMKQLPQLAQGTMVKWGNRDMCTLLVFPDIMDVEEKHHVIFLLGKEKYIWPILGVATMGIILPCIPTAF